MTVEEKKGAPDNLSYILAAIEAQSVNFQRQFDKQNTQLEKLNEEQTQQNQFIRNELLQIKQGLSSMAEKCDLIDQRCGRLDNEMADCVKEWVAPLMVWTICS